MFYWLIELSNTFPSFGAFRTLLNVFRYITFRTGGAVVTGALFVFLFGPWIIDHLRIRQGKGQPIRADGPQSHLLTKKGTPTMGGLMILSGLTVGTVLWANPLNPYVWIVLAVTLGFGFVGFYDDYLKVTKQTTSGFGGKIRLVIEAVIALVACYALVRLNRDPSSTALAIPFFSASLRTMDWIRLTSCLCCSRSNARVVCAFASTLATMGQPSLSGILVTKRIVVCTSMPRSFRDVGARNPPSPVTPPASIRNVTMHVARSSGVSSTSIAVRGRGWVSGISSAVRLAPMMPARRAVVSTSPFAAAP